jgi:hypothetical protein
VAHLFVTVQQIGAVLDLAATHHKTGESQVRRFALIVLLICPLTASADETWTPMKGDEIRAALTGRTLQYQTAWQDFRASGKTLYTAGADSWGNWRIEDDQYCSQWPPNDLWTCYKMDRSGEKLRFVGPNNDMTEAVYTE